MRAPTYDTVTKPVEAYKARFSAPAGTTLESMLGRVLEAGGTEMTDLAAMHPAIQSMADDTAGRARALQDRAALTSLIAAHAGLNGGAAVAAQPDTLDALARVRTDGQDSLGTPGMIAAYDHQIAPALGNATDQVTRYTLQQALAERQAIASQELKAAQQAAAASWQSPQRLVQGLAAVKEIAVSQVGDGASEDDRSQAVRAAVGGAVSGAVSQALSANEPEFAAHIIGGWGGALSPAAYQVAVARLGQAAQAQRMNTIFSQAAGGNAGGESSAEQPVQSKLGGVEIPAALGAAIHPIAGGTIASIDGSPDNATVSVLHPDGSTTAYGGLGLAAVTPGDQVTPAHVIGSASPVVTMAANAPDGGSADAAMLLQQAGGTGAIVGGPNTPRIWDIPAMLGRIAGRSDLSPQEQALATSFATRRMNADHAQQAANDVNAGQGVVSLLAAAPDRYGQAADLPSDLADRMSSSALAQVDNGLRNAAMAATAPQPGNAVALRLELQQRQAPDVFARSNLVSLIGEVHPTDLARLALAQSTIAAGTTRDASESRTAILDALARHEIINGTPLSDEALPNIQSTAGTLARLGQVDPADNASIDKTVADAIQTQTNQA